jgi:glycosyltransferase involved in cell wall biosynthesis
MRILYLTFGPLNAQSSHLVYLHYALPILQNRHKITILNMSGDEDEAASDTFKLVEFRKIKCDMSGWEINNLKGILSSVEQLVVSEGVELVVLQMEVWELMRELPVVLSGKTTFVTMVHAMPFLGSPIMPSMDFEADVRDYAASLKTGFRTKYNLMHYREAESVFESGKFITSNQSTDWYIKHYFPMTSTHVINDHKKGYQPDLPKEKKFDLVYMARMEEGKGVKYFHEILSDLSKRLGRKISLVVLGRTDDEISQQDLQNLVDLSSRDGLYEIVNVGWAGQKEKEYYLGSSSVFVYPSEHDNNPEVVYEAQSFGLPCVLWDLPFSRRSFSQSRSILLAKHLDIGNMVDKIELALENRDDLSQIGRDYVRSGKTPEEFAKILEDIYSAVMME